MENNTVVTHEFISGTPNNDFTDPPKTPWQRSVCNIPHLRAVLNSGAWIPSTEVLGYFRMSLRDGTAAAFAERDSGGRIAMLTDVGPATPVGCIR